MDSIKLKTPMQLWEGYDPKAADLEINIINRNIHNSIITTLYSYTALSVADGRVRIFLSVMQKEGSSNLPVVLYIPGYQEKEPCSSLAKLVNNGLAVATINYSGESGELPAPKYPKSLEHGYYSKIKGKRHDAAISVDQTSLHLWCKVVRRAMTLLDSIPTLDTSRLCGMAWSGGANILWQVAGIDNRIKLMVPILNSGYGEYKGYYKYSSTPEPEYSEERTRWIVGLAAQSYAKFLHSETYIVAATNDNIHAVDRCDDIMELIPDGVACRKLLACGLDRQIYSGSVESIVTYITERLVQQRDMACQPTITESVVDGKVMIDVSIDSRYDTPDSLELCYSSGEIKGEYRNWKIINLGLDFQGNANSPIKIYDTSQRCYVYATVRYKSGLSLSSKIDSFIPSSIGNVIVDTKGTRIIYERKMGVNCFFPSSGKHVVASNGVFPASGPLDIMGVTTSENLLINYNIGDIHCDDEESLLQVDIHSSTETTVKVAIVDGNGKEYFSEFLLKGEGEWTRVQLNCGEFKDIGLVALKNWSNVKVLKIYKANAMIINNILWV